MVLDTSTDTIKIETINNKTFKSNKVNNNETEISKLNGAWNKHNKRLK